MRASEIILIAEAVRDLETGRQFYDEREQGLGDYFIDSLLSDIESLHLYAGIHSQHFGYLRLPSNRFPFAIYYDLDGKIARVIAVFDMRRNPDGIRNSLTARKGESSAR